LALEGSLEGTVVAQWPRMVFATTCFEVLEFVRPRSLGIRLSGPYFLDVSPPSTLSLNVMPSGNTILFKRPTGLPDLAAQT